MICEYKNDMQHGIERAFYGNGKVWYQKYYHEGKEQPEWEIYDSDGTQKYDDNTKNHMQ